jgi:hypothetical protein
MAHMLRVPALQLGNPVTPFVLVQVDDLIPTFARTINVGAIPNPRTLIPGGKSTL